jgi:hypothetical protein
MRNVASSSQSSYLSFVHGKASEDPRNGPSATRTIQPENLCSLEKKAEFGAKLRPSFVRLGRPTITFCRYSFALTACRTA